LAEARDGWYATADSLGVFLFDLRPLAMTGDLADLVEFEVELDRADGVPADAAMEVMWLVGPHWTGPLMFTGRCGRLLVPLSAHPDWLLAGRVDGLALRLKDAQRFRGVRARLVGFHRIRPPAGA
jgi:hypothetical protein